MWVKTDSNTLFFQTQMKSRNGSLKDSHVINAWVSSLFWLWTVNSFPQAIIDFWVVCKSVSDSSQSLKTFQIFYILLTWLYCTSRWHNEFSLCSVFSALLLKKWHSFSSKRIVLFLIPSYQDTQLNNLIYHSKKELLTLIYWKLIFRVLRDMRKNGMKISSCQIPWFLYLNIFQN